MAESITLARPYARAAFEVAVADGQLQEWSTALAAVAAIVTQKKISVLLASPALTAADKSAAMLNVLGEVFSKKFANFVIALADNKRLSMLPEIRDLYWVLKADYEKSLDVNVTTAYPIDANLLDKLSRALAEKLGRRVKLSSAVDQSLLGGALIRAGDTVIDGSVKGRLTKLAEAMNA
jgi:F-type H+-transporting ATPase subunit delta